MIYFGTHKVMQRQTTVIYYSLGFSLYITFFQYLFSLTCTLSPTHSGEQSTVSIPIENIKAFESMRQPPVEFHEMSA